ncbi:MAG: DUF6398 domain-containing protein [Aggregatilineales bacterium]
MRKLPGLTDAFADAYLNEEWKPLCRQLTATLCRKRPSPVVTGKANVRAAGILHALGMVNFLFDPSQTPHARSTQIPEYFKTAQSTVQAKPKQIRDLLGMYQLSPGWSLPSRLDRNPLAWMISVNGLILDARHLPRPIQEEAFRKGLIPYIPDAKQ